MLGEKLFFATPILDRGKFRQNTKNVIKNVFIKQPQACCVCKQGFSRSRNTIRHVSNHLDHHVCQIWAKNRFLGMRGGPKTCILLYIFNFIKIQTYLVCKQGFLRSRKMIRHVSNHLDHHVCQMLAKNRFLGMRRGPKNLNFIIYFKFHQNIDILGMQIGVFEVEKHDETCFKPLRPSCVQNFGQNRFLGMCCGPKLHTLHSSHTA